MAGQPMSIKTWATEQIRSMIYDGELAAGDKVLIETLAQRLEISRTPVRDALWQLAAEGLVTVAPRVGAFVRRIGPRETHDIYRIKIAVEPLLAAWAAERSPMPDRHQYRAAVAQLATAAAADDVTTYTHLLEQRRRQLVALAGSPPMADVLNVIDGRVRLLRYRNLGQPGRMRLSAARHMVIAEAIVAGDADTAARTMRVHMEDAAQAINVLLSESAEVAG
jgi:DNA-binding GntR family transcriptional regulator